MKTNLRFLATALPLSSGPSQPLPQRRLGRLVIAVAAGSLVLGAIGAPAQASPVPSGSDEYIVILHGGSDAPSAAERHRKKDGAQISHVYTAALRGFSATLTAAGAAAVRADPEVAQVTRSRILKSPQGVQAPLCNPGRNCPQVVPRGIRRVQADLSSTKSGDGHGAVDAKIAVVDTGIDGTHPDLAVVGGVNCVSDGLRARVDDVGHGTMVAGVAAGKDDNGYVVGTAPGARLWSVRVLGSNSEGTDADIICGIDWVTATRTDKDPHNDIDVANMSIIDDVPNFADDNNCGYTNGDVLHQAICGAAAAGIPFVVAAGNFSDDLTNYRPASYHEVLTVTGMTDGDGKPGGLKPEPCFGDPDDVAVFFSNYGRSSDAGHLIAAPASCIGSDYPRHSVNLEDGTSFAAPHVTGAVALCIASGACAGLTSLQIVHKMVSDALIYSQAHPTYGFLGDPLHPVGTKYYGPLLNVALY